MTEFEEHASAYSRRHRLAVVPPGSPVWEVLAVTDLCTQHTIFPECLAECADRGVASFNSIAAAGNVRLKGEPCFQVGGCLNGVG